VILPALSISPGVCKGTANVPLRPSSSPPSTTPRNSNPLGDGTRSVPNAAERGGDFNQSFTTQTIGGALQRYPIQVHDPLSIDTASGNRRPFPGNVIPKSRLSPIAQALLGYVPLPNTPNDPTGNDSNNYVPLAIRNDKFPALSIRGIRTGAKRSAASSRSAGTI
jgi:hypothetical protein